uniref:Methionine aminopeptidase 2 n=1 Tax=Coccidioides posadasii RMSCC 3488 TaxID=454284 RepID=A0A0J6F3L5_COCPO|nr:methionine aminopeptidase 2 [Coccidioides posadasii RMSCC 3488]
MGSETPHGHRRSPNGSSTHAAIATVSLPKPAATSRLFHGPFEGEGEDGENDEDDEIRADLKSSGQPSKAGIDARIDHISEEIQEVMESYEIELNRKIIPVKAIRNITGHNILRYKIHGDKQLPFVKTRTTQRMEEGDVFAIETFGSTGKAYLRDDVGVYGYGCNEHASATGLRHASAKSLLKTIHENFGTLVFSRRYLERIGVKNYHLGMRSLVSNGIVESYAPMVDVPGSYVAQFEHTVLVRPNCKEVISRGDDY